MCYGTDRRPPSPPHDVEGQAIIAGGAGASLVLEASDGCRFAAFAAAAPQRGGPGIVILPDVRGLHPFYEDLALRFAQAGVHAAAFDYFGRTAGVGRRGDDFDFWPEVMKTHPDTVALDVAATAAYLTSEGATSIFTVGFCFGGRHSFNQAARNHGLAGVIGFYGVVAPRSPEDFDAPIHRAPDYRCPVLGLFGGADPGIPPETVEAFDRALDVAGVEHELQMYEGAPHSFFDRAFEQYREASNDAWTRVLGFIRAHSS